MTTTEHLDRIRAKCVELLEIASKRTPGKWHMDKARGVMTRDGVPVCYPFGSYEVEANEARFIASCAGPAEAGWRATIAAIDFIEEFRRTKWGWDGDCGLGVCVDQMEHTILAAWPEELL